MKLTRSGLVFIAALWGTTAAADGVVTVPGPATVTVTTPPPSPCDDKSPLVAKITAVGVNDSGPARDVALGDLLTIAVSDGTMAKLRARAACRKQEIGLFVDGLWDKDTPIINTSTPDQIKFALDRNADNKQLWKSVLVAGVLGSNRKMTLAVGTADAQDLTEEWSTVLRPFNTLRVALSGTVFLMLLGLIFWQGRVGTMLRDPGTHTYSLSRVQMAWWTVVSLFSIVFIWSVTGEVQTLSTTMLGLMGIGAGTALGAAVVDASKTTAAAATTVVVAPSAVVINQPPPVPAPVNLGPSLGFLNDILSDSNGFAFHRVQMLIWTLLVSLIFVYGVVSTLAIPDVDSTFLALLGISNGTYLGFKLPEK